MVLDAHLRCLFTDPSKKESFARFLKKEIGCASKAPSSRTIPSRLLEGKSVQIKKLLPIVLGSLLIFAIYGCNAPESGPDVPPATPTSEAADDHADHDHGDHATVDGESPMAKMMPGLKELPAEDYESAMAQHMCPVSGEMLGTMGAPKKVEVNGEFVWICCDGCRDKLLADPDKYLTKQSQ